MKIFHKILGITLPIALIALFMGSWITYHLSRKALNQIAERWLATRLKEAVSMVEQHERFLRLYGITNIQAGTRKAQLDAFSALESIKIGKHGYIYLLNRQGKLIFHPGSDKNFRQAGPEPWIARMTARPGTAVIYPWHGEKHLGMAAFFRPWQWTVVATAPLDEIYGPMNSVRNYLLALAICGSIGISFLIIILTRRLVNPLQLLVQGTRQVGKGDLDVHIPVKSQDEIGQLSRAFNTMSLNLKKSLGDLKRSELRLHRLNARLLSTQEDERRRLSIELHDEVGQSLAVLKLNVILLEESLENTENKKACEEMVTYIDQVIANVRQLCKDLTPPAIEDLGLSAALMWLIDTIKKHYTITADINGNALDTRLSLDSQILIYRIFQEAISNVLRHADADTLILAAVEKHDHIVFSIQDNGKGFDLTTIQATSCGDKGLGLHAMQERARMLDSSLTIQTGKGQGTLLQFVVTLDKKKTHEKIFHHIGG